MLGTGQGKLWQGNVSEEERRQGRHPVRNEDPAQGCLSEEKPAGTHLHRAHHSAEHQLPLPGASHICLPDRRQTIHGAGFHGRRRALLLAEERQVLRYNTW